MRRRNLGLGERLCLSDGYRRLRSGNGSTEPLRSGEGVVGGAEHVRATPRSTLERREAKRRVGFEWLVLWTFGCFLAVPLYLIFYGKREGLPNGDPRLRPHRPPSSEDRSTYGVLRFVAKACGVSTKTTLFS